MLPTSRLFTGAFLGKTGVKNSIHTTSTSILFSFINFNFQRSNFSPNTINIFQCFEENRCPHHDVSQAHSQHLVCVASNTQALAIGLSLNIRYNTAGTLQIGNFRFAKVTKSSAATRFFPSNI